MRLRLQPDKLARFVNELSRARRREIGGVLVGAHESGLDFTLMDFSVQRRGGGRAHFNRDPVAAARFVDDVIARTGGDPSRVNYLGEWHSHPSMSASPSRTDALQMQSIVDDPDEIATFGLLIVVSGRPWGLAMSATLFHSALPAEPAQIAIDAADDDWQQTSSEVWDDDAHDDPCDRQAGKDDALWQRSRIGLTLRRWWKRCCGRG